MGGSLEVAGVVYINDGLPLTGTLTVEQEHIEVRSALPRPDPAWTFVDGNGHWHAYDEANELPTIRVRTEHRDCDGSCGGVCEGEGYTVNRYLCRICNEEIKPSALGGVHTTVLPGPRSWRVEVTGTADLMRLNSEVTVRFVEPMRRGSMFGVALPTDGIYESTGTGRRTLVGVGPLGRRPS